MTAKEATDKNIITKQVVINTPTSVRLLPITADEKVIDEIQQALTELEELKATVKELLDIPITVSTVSGTSLLIKTMNKLKKLVGAKDE